MVKIPRRYNKSGRIPKAAIWSFSVDAMNFKAGIR